MRSLPRIVKEPDKGQAIKPFDFFAGFKIHEEEPPEEPEDIEELLRKLSRELSA